MAGAGTRTATAGRSATGRRSLCAHRTAARSHPPCPRRRPRCVGRAPGTGCRGRCRSAPAALEPAWGSGSCRRCSSHRRCERRHDRPPALRGGIGGAGGAERPRCSAGRRPRTARCSARRGRRARAAHPPRRAPRPRSGRAPRREAATFHRFEATCRARPHRTTPHSFRA